MNEYKVIIRKEDNNNVISDEDRKLIFPKWTPYDEYDTILESVTFNDHDLAKAFILNAIAIIPELYDNEDLACIVMGDSEWNHAYRKSFSTCWLI